ncbi:Imidazolonepropionase [Microbacterium lemovicicum]|uniref:Imidazolonepropionase n=1 Tax=Microbacterium lemovicicum TaxID=1072463 RepID=A0A3Q9IXF6_9MICO|nr:amidohydrolase family protein [Microbacterium lemovicicum]AZS35790.1 Imidazolonepropionase [Microbacterium lemovicicum]
MKLYTADRLRTHDALGTIDAGGIVVDDEGLISWVGPAADLPVAYSDLASHHLAGTLMPGLIDTHVHLGFDGGPAPVARMMAESDADQLVLMLHSARELLSAGVTTARDLGARGYLDVVVRDAIARGDARGPRIIASGSPLTPTGGHCWFMGGEADGGFELRTAVRRHHEHGVDSIKIMSTGGFMTKGSAPWFAQYSEKELALAVSDAHRLGKKAVAHAHGIEGIRHAVRGGIDALEHCSFVTADGSFGFDAGLADEIAAAGVYVSFTLNVLAWRMINQGSGGFVDHFAMVVRELRARGVRIVTGTDAGIDNAPHYAYAAGLEVLEAVGIPRGEVLHAATAIAAESMGIEDEVGRLREGMSADIIGVTGDPEKDLTCLRSPALVVARGAEFSADSYADFSDMPEPESATAGFPHDH